MLKLKDIEDAWIADARAHIAEIKTVTTHEKEFDEQTLINLMPLMPFTLVRYAGTTPEETERNADGSSGIKRRSLQLAVGASTLRSRKEGQRGCYDILDDLRERYDGLTLVIGGVSITFVYDGDQLLFTDGTKVVYGMLLSYCDN